MLGYIVYERKNALKNENYINWYIEKFEKKGVKVKLVFSDQIKKIKLPDFAIIRDMRWDITCFLEERGVKCFNNSFVSKTTNDKFLCYKYLKEKGIEILDIYKNIEDVKEYPVVLKPKNSHGGDRVFLVKNRKEFEKKLGLYEKGNLIIQKVASDVGKDLRVYVIGSEIVVSMLRESKKDFRSNFCLGGKASVYNLSEEERKIVYSVVDKFEFDFVGVDFLFNNGKLVFNEIEDVVGSRMVYSLTEIDIVDLYINHILQKI